MPRNGSGTMVLPSGNPVVTGTTIDSTAFNTTMTDIATALSGSVSADGQTPITANIPLAGFKVTGAGAASASTDYATLGDVQSQIDTRYVSGRVLQEYINTDAGTSTTSATLAGVTAVAQPITPKSTTSKLLVEVTFQAVVTASGPAVNSVGAFRLYDFTNSADIGTEYTLGVSSGSGANLQGEAPVVLRAIVTNSVTTERDFTLRARRATGTPTVSAVAQVWSIREIKN